MLTEVIMLNSILMNIRYLRNTFDSDIKSNTWSMIKKCNISDKDILINVQGNRLGKIIISCKA